MNNSVMHRDLIVFGEDWGGLPSSTQQLIKHLSKTRQVIWVNSIGLRQPKLCKHDLKRALDKILAVGAQKAPKMADSSDRFTVINPKTIPAPVGFFSRYIAAALLSYQIRRVIKQTMLVNPILWISLPTAVDVVGKLGESAVVYYCCDDFSALQGVDHETVVSREKQLANDADLVLTSSKVLTAKFNRRNTITIEHGVDFKLFATPTNPAPDLPNNGRPTAGYYGSISAWLDLALLDEIISRLPHWNFVFIGEISVDVSLLRRHHNVHFLGPRPHHQLPKYSQHWTASLLPFLHNRQIEACNPFKLREYLAAGRPIISTKFPALSPYLQFIDVVDGASEMVLALKKASNTKHTDQLKRQSVACDSWQVRADKVARFMDRL